MTTSDPQDEDLIRAAVVHDVNQMLAVITGRAGLLLDRLHEAPDLRDLRAILLASADASAMLRRLRPAVGAGSTDAGGAVIREAVEQARLLVWPADDPRYHWENSVAPELQTAVPAQVLREVLANLLLNALAVMSAGGRISISAAADEAPIRLYLADDGPGLPAGDPEQIFAVGFSGSGKAGRGTGLAGCRSLLREAGGDLTAQRGATGGAVLVLELPVGVAARRGRRISVTAAPALAVLVVDDEAGVREMLSDVLTEWGCRVQACRDAATTLTEYTPGSAVVALIDQNLPGLGGLELATRLRVGDPCLSIVLISGWQHDDAMTATDPAVIDLKARKPLELDRIREILNLGQQLNQTRRAAAARD